MSLATRCTACGTIFRVVQDQLKVSDGWVRCGRCQAVFNAQESLFDLDREAPPAWQPPTPSMPSEPSADAGPHADAGDDAAERTDTEGPIAEPVRAAPVSETAVNSDTAHGAAGDVGDDVGDTLHHTGPETGPAARHGLGETVGSAADADADAGGPGPSDIGIDTGAADPHADAESARGYRDETDTDTSADTTPTPGFVRDAQRSERWQRRPVKTALWLVTALAALGLAVQVTHHFRHRLAAQSAQAGPWLQWYCAVADCRIDALRQIDDVSIESTALTQGDAADPADRESRALRLTVVLRNRGELTIAMPSVDLSLTSTDGELVSRRSLSPLDFRVAEARLAPGVDTPLSVSFVVAGRRVSGYTVEVFYP